MRVILTQLLVYIVDDRKDAYGNPVGGQGAKAVVTIFNGEITDINIIDFGSGYSDQFPPKNLYCWFPPLLKHL